MVDVANSRGQSVASRARAWKGEEEEEDGDEDDARESACEPYSTPAALWLGCIVSDDFHMDKAL